MVQWMRNAARRLFNGLKSSKYGILDAMPGWLADPWDDRLARLSLALQSVRSDWDVEAMRGRNCSRSLWMGHAAFAHALVMFFRPRVVVDLGVLAGCSSIAMGLALKRLGRGVLYAVDTWQGDAHTGQYGEAVYRNFCADVRKLDLERFVAPMRMTFAQAAGRLSGPIDMLHVDGFHTFGAALGDFRLFRGRLIPGAPVLFHDVFNPDFPGLRLLWRLLGQRYRTYRFPHASGLGVLLTSGGDRNFGLPIRSDLIALYKAVRQRIEAAGEAAGAEPVGRREYASVVEAPAA
jgi:hypothetical protein